MTDLERRLAAEAVPLLQALIRNACVNDGSPGSGHESRNVDTLVAVLDGPGIELERFEPAPGRDNMVARIPGSDPHGPTLLLHAHTDVMPADPQRWAFDPFGGELVDEEVWGRGAVASLNHAATIAVAMRALADEGFRPAGTLVFAATADKEHGGGLGVPWLAAHHPDRVRADWVITGTGGVASPSPAGMRLPVVVGEKGWHRLRVVVSGEPVRPSWPGHDSAIVRGAEAVSRLAGFEAPSWLDDRWWSFVESSGWATVLADLFDPDRREYRLDALPPFPAQGLRALMRTTLCPVRIVGGGFDGDGWEQVAVEVDARTLEGDEGSAVEGLVGEALGDLAPYVTIESLGAAAATSSPVDATLWPALERRASPSYPGAGLVPLVSPGRTAAPAFRALGAVAYGFGLYSERMTPELLARMIHGADERMDVASLGLMAGLWTGLAADLLGPDRR